MSPNTQVMCPVRTQRGEREEEVRRLARPQKENGPLRGPFLCRALVVVATMLDDHHPVSVAMAPPAFMPAVIAMFAELGMRAVAVMITAALDHDGLGVGNRRCRNRDRAKRRDDQSKLLHAFLLG